MAEKFEKAERVGMTHTEFYLMLLNVDEGMPIIQAADKVLGADSDKRQHFESELNKWAVIRRSV